MKILYGVQGTGNGHIARARAMACELKKAKIEVDFLFSGREDAMYFSMEAFGNYQTRNGVTFSTHNGKIDYIKTAQKCSPVALINEIKQLDLSGYELVINDFEPISAWAAKRSKLPCIGISHQNAFRYAVPKKGYSWLDSKVIRYFAPADIHIGLHWYHFGQPILPPIVHTEKNYQIESGQKVLVYLPFESLESITELLQGFSNRAFLCYHPEIRERIIIDNIEFREPSYQGFQIELHRCHGVIANGGFELPSEALSLGKKLLLKPLSGQFEQESNVATLEHLGLAHAMEYLDPSAVRQWLDAKDAESIKYPNVAKSIVEWILMGNWNNTHALEEMLWNQVDFPDYAAI